jgi:hypothetical protein
MLALAGMPYVSEYSSRRDRYLYAWARQETVIPIGGYEWMLKISPYEKSPIAVGPDTIRVRFDSASGVLEVAVGPDSLTFDLRRLAGEMSDDPSSGSGVPAERLRLTATHGSRRGMLALESLNGRRDGSSVKVERWQGTLYLGQGSDRRGR